MSTLPLGHPLPASSPRPHFPTLRACPVAAPSASSRSTSELVAHLLRAGMETASALAFREWVLRELRDHFDCGSAIFVDECKGGCTTGGQPGALAVGSRLDARVAARGVHLASLTMFRHPGAPPFDDEDRRALSEVLPALTAIFSAHKHLDSSEPTASRVAPALGPRLRQTLALLLSGMSEKEVAAAMALSPHTVHQYVKKLYRAHRVRSRPELLAALLSR